MCSESGRLYPLRKCSIMRFHRVRTLSRASLRIFQSSNAHPEAFEPKNDRGCRASPTGPPAAKNKEMGRKGCNE